MTQSWIFRFVVINFLLVLKPSTNCETIMLSFLLHCNLKFTPWATCLRGRALQMTSHLVNKVESIEGCQQYKYKVVFLSRSLVIEKIGWGGGVEIWKVPLYLRRKQFGLHLKEQGSREDWAATVLAGFLGPFLPSQRSSYNSPWASIGCALFFICIQNLFLFPWFPHGPSS